MRPEIRRADERWEVLAAAAEWRAVRAIDDAQLAAIAERHRDDRRRSKPAFRLLFFLFTLFAGQALWGFVATLGGLLHAGGATAHALVLSGLAILAGYGADEATRTHRLRAFGVEEALVALALVWSSGAIFLGLERLQLGSRPALALGAGALALLAGGALWRWGPPLTGALAAGALFAALYALSAARAAWISAGVALAFLAWRAAADPRWGPAHRRRCAEIFVVAALALYFAVHVSGLEGGWFRWLARDGGLARAVPEAARSLAWAAMAALPAVLLALGLARRRRLALTLGALLGLATAASAVDALDLEPAWWVALAGGVALVALALAARTLFAGAPERIAGGFTDRPLFEASGRGSFLEIGATLLALSPAPRESEPPPGFEGRGGEFGGGGASGKF